MINFAREQHKRVPADWYTDSFENNPLQRYWHSRRIGVVTDNLPDKTKKMLDVGCCDGFMTDKMVQKSNPEMTYGIDALEKCISYANKTYGNKKLKFEVGDAHKLRFRNSTFDIVTCLESLEHVKEPNVALKEMCRVLKPGGKIYILVPQETLLFKSIWFVWERTRGKIWKNTHIQSFNSKGISKLLKKAAFKEIKKEEFMLNMLMLFIAEKPKNTKQTTQLQ
ncbi:class I SAM-dependent methyltransferase [Patescibacteria group bacterium]